jgi:uncharacterized integral membrane protein
MSGAIIMKNQWRLVAGIILIIIIVLFAVFNVDSVPVNFGFAVLDGPLIIVILVSLLMGSLITLLVTEKVKQLAGGCRLSKTIDADNGTVESNILRPETAHPGLNGDTRYRSRQDGFLVCGVLAVEHFGAGHRNHAHSHAISNKCLAGRQGPA